MNINQYITSLGKKVVNQRKISCDGDTGASGHPKIYLEIKYNVDETVCPYCGKQFIYVKDTFIK